MKEIFLTTAASYLIPIVVIADDKLFIAHDKQLSIVGISDNALPRVHKFIYYVLDGIDIIDLEEVLIVCEASISVVDYTGDLKFSRSFSHIDNWNIVGPTLEIDSDDGHEIINLGNGLSF